MPFYDHYSNKSELVLNLMNQYFEELKFTCRNLTDEKINNKIVYWIKFFVKNQNFFNKLLVSHDSYQFRNKLNEFIKAQLLTEMNSANKLKIDFVCFGISGIIVNIVLERNELDINQLVSNMSEILLPYLNLSEME